MTELTVINSGFQIPAKEDLVRKEATIELENDSAMRGALSSAIQKFNGQKFGKRPIAVDWAIPKNIYSIGANVSAASEDAGLGFVASSDSDSYEKEDMPAEVDFEQEVDIARKVLRNLTTSSPKGSASFDMGDGALPKGIEEPDTVKTVNVPSKLSDDNLSSDVENEEVKQWFSAFGEVQSFVPVLNQVTKRPRGIGFLKFKTTDGASAAVSAANVASGLGIFLKGLILDGTPTVEGVSTSDMAKRNK
ncbi:unnamed protein product [Dovyalis caffra]|uniref:RRM domain-containing protein n=1 Tax=Dovyalis caffra TaxID=77055 RepID=A0AAV1R5Y0_9ROSI|nr:unnamed protein product [Dovyalis caffra]